MIKKPLDQSIIPELCMNLQNAWRLGACKTRCAYIWSNLPTSPSRCSDWFLYRSVVFRPPHSIGRDLRGRDLLALRRVLWLFRTRCQRGLWRSGQMTFPPLTPQGSESQLRGIKKLSLWNFCMRLCGDIYYEEKCWVFKKQRGRKNRMYCCFCPAGYKAVYCCVLKQGLLTVSM